MMHLCIKQCTYLDAPASFRLPGIKVKGQPMLFDECGGPNGDILLFQRVLQQQSDASTRLFTWQRLMSQTFNSIQYSFIRLLNYHAAI